MSERDARPEIAALVLSKLATGSLPSVRARRVWAGKGSGSRCYGCDQPITATQIENEVDLAGFLIVRLHAQCFTIWQEALETSGREIRGGSGRCWPRFVDAADVESKDAIAAQLGGAPEDNFSR